MSPKPSCNNARVSLSTPFGQPPWSEGKIHEPRRRNLERLGQPAFRRRARSQPLAPNPDGHIIRWRDSRQHTGTTFTWDIFLIAQDTHGTEGSFASPDGLWVDPDGRVFIQTDGGQKDGLNNQMVVVDPESLEIRRLFTGVTDDEITGVAYTPDRRTLFINTQHPGEADPDTTNFPAPLGSGKVPRDTTFVITRKDGGVVGS